MGFLQSKKAYLSGPIEHQVIKTLNWRDPVKENLSSLFGINVFDPHADPKQQWASELLEARNNKDYVRMAEIAERFVKKDLGEVDRSDFLVVNLPYGVPTTGTHHEIIVASNAKKPVLIVCEDGKENIPLWYYGFIPLDFMFSNWSGLYEYLGEVDQGLHKDNKKWLYVYGLI